MCLLARLRLPLTAPGVQDMLDCATPKSPACSWRYSTGGLPASDRTATRCCRAARPGSRGTLSNGNHRSTTCRPNVAVRQGRLDEKRLPHTGLLPHKHTIQPRVVQVVRNHQHRAGVPTPEYALDLEHLRAQVVAVPLDIAEPQAVGVWHHKLNSTRQSAVTGSQPQLVMRVLASTRCRAQSKRRSLVARNWPNTVPSPPTTVPVRNWLTARRSG